MTESSGFFTTTPETFYTEEQYNRYNNALQSNGVIPAELTNDDFDAENLLEVVESDVPALSVKVQSGHCLIQGYWAYNSADKSLTIAANSSGNLRIDRIVERLDKTANTVSLAVLTGTPGVTPTPPALTRTSTVWEISLAQVEVINGATTITNSDITDERGDPAVCGWATAAYRINEDLDAHEHKIVNLADPTAPQDAATKAYVDGGVAGFSISDVLVDADKNWNNRAVTNIKSHTYNSVKATASDTLKYSDDANSYHGAKWYKIVKSVIVPKGYNQRNRESSLRVKFTLTVGIKGSASAYVYIPCAGKMGTVRTLTATNSAEYSEDFTGIAGNDSVMVMLSYYDGGSNAHISNFRVYATDSATTETVGSSGTITW